MGDVSTSCHLLGGKYVLGDRVGAGGMGVVYQAFQPALERVVAVKLLRRELMTDVRSAEHFRREALAAARVAHPNLIAVIDVGETDDGRPFLVMEYVPGKRLGALVQGNPMPVERAIGISRQLLAALAETHQAGVVHADVKSDNVMVDTTRDGTDRVKLLDFGLARIGGSGGRSSDIHGDRCVSGTPEYMAPEVIRGGVPTPATDLYGVGVILYELLTGATPFAGGCPLEIMSRHLTDGVVPPSLRRPGLAISRELERVIARALAKSPGSRFGTADEFSLALGHAGTAWVRGGFSERNGCGQPLRHQEDSSAGWVAIAPALASSVIGAEVDTNVWRAGLPFGHRRMARGSAITDFVNRERVLRTSIGSAILTGAIENIAAGYLDLAAQLMSRGAIRDAIRELEEGVGLLGVGGSGLLLGPEVRALTRLGDTLADLRRTFPAYAEPGGTEHEIDVPSVAFI